MIVAYVSNFSTSVIHAKDGNLHRSRDERLIQTQRDKFNINFTIRSACTEQPEPCNEQKIYKMALNNQTIFRRLTSTTIYIYLKNIPFIVKNLLTCLQPWKECGMDRFVGLIPCSTDLNWKRWMTDQTIDFCICQAWGQICWKSGDWFNGHYGRYRAHSNGICLTDCVHSWERQNSSLLRQIPWL